ncbi:hypothetical protein AA313_de0201551 [Arthrobotrys entomopaga]|nr:hypothetical protein AA313_de0201551 [Arthrobotrys entomopaga]
MSDMTNFIDRCFDLIEIAIPKLFRDEPTIVPDYPDKIAEHAGVALWAQHMSPGGAYLSPNNPAIIAQLKTLALQGMGADTVFRGIKYKFTPGKTSGTTTPMSNLS